MNKINIKDSQNFITSKIILKNNKIYKFKKDDQILR